MSLKKKKKKTDRKWQPLFLFTHCRSWEESSTWMPSHSVCPRLHHEPEQAWKGVLQYRCGRFNFYGFKALPEPQTHWIRSTGNCLVRKKYWKKLIDLISLFWSFQMHLKGFIRAWSLNNCHGNSKGLSFSQVMTTKPSPWQLSKLCDVVGIPEKYTLKLTFRQQYFVKKILV